jgi:hypothetical protein
MFPFDFTYKLPVAKCGTCCQSVVGFSTIRMACVQAMVVLSLYFVSLYFGVAGLFRNDKDAHRLVELDAPVSVRGGIVRR